MFLKLQKKITNFVTTLDLISDKDVKKKKKSSNRGLSFPGTVHKN